MVKMQQPKLIVRTGTFSHHKILCGCHSTLGLASITRADGLCGSSVIGGLENEMHGYDCFASVVTKLAFPMQTLRKTRVSRIAKNGILESGSARSHPRSGSSWDLSVPKSRYYRSRALFF